jgi:hypothetical protein
MISIILISRQPYIAVKYSKTDRKLGVNLLVRKLLTSNRTDPILNAVSANMPQTGRFLRVKRPADEEKNYHILKRVSFESTTEEY